MFYKNKFIVLVLTLGIFLFIFGLFSFDYNTRNCRDPRFAPKKEEIACGQPTAYFYPTEARFMIGLGIILIVVPLFLDRNRKLRKLLLEAVREEKEIKDNESQK